jgi:hypothetical protein
MGVYECLRCNKVYGWHPKLPNLPNIPDEGHLRYADCDIWRCPHCGAQQDSRDIQPFLGCGGGHSVRELSEEEVRRLGEPRLFHFGPDGFPDLIGHHRIDEGES